MKTPKLDLAALEALVADYKDAGLVCAAADLKKRLEWYRKRPEADPKGLQDL